MSARSRTEREWRLIWHTVNRPTRRLDDVGPLKGVQVSLPNQSTGLEPGGDLFLVVIVELAAIGVPRNKDRTPTAHQRGERRTDAGMKDHNIGILHGRL